MAPRDGWLARQADKIKAQEPAMRAATRFIEAGGRGMTDERMCARCGEVHEDYPMPDAPPYDADNLRRIAAFEEADPSTDEGEAQGLIVHRDYEENGGWWWSVNYSDGKGFPVHVPDVVEAAIRAPLEERAESYHAAYREALASAEQANLRAREAGKRAEAAEDGQKRLAEAFCEVWLEEVSRFRSAEERIQELEAERGILRSELKVSREYGYEERVRDTYRHLDLTRARAEAAEAEVERLREALRRIRAMASPQGWDFGDAAIVREVDAALATPPSSTEGTKEVEG